MSVNVPTALTTINATRTPACAVFGYGCLLDLNDTTHVAGAARQFGFANPGVGRTNHRSSAGCSAAHHQGRTRPVSRDESVARHRRQRNQEPTNRCRLLLLVQMRRLNLIHVEQEVVDSIWLRHALRESNGSSSPVEAAALWHQCGTRSGFLYCSSSSRLACRDSRPVPVTSSAQAAASRTADSVTSS